MKAVWLSSTYYLDPAISSLPHGDAERLFTRAIAYCGNAETRGFVPKSALKTFGIRAVSRRVSELIDAGIGTKLTSLPTAATSQDTSSKPGPSGTKRAMTCSNGSRATGNVSRSGVNG